MTCDVPILAVVIFKLALLLIVPSLLTYYTARKRANRVKRIVENQAKEEIELIEIKNELFNLKKKQDEIIKRSKK